MFYGEFAHSLDTKNRITIPSKFRSLLGDMFIMNKGWDNSLNIFTLEAWKTFEERVKNMPKSEELARRFARIFFGGAVECEPDSAGRVLVPLNMREYAGIKRDIVILGVSDRVEIWSKENFEKLAVNEIGPDLQAAMKEYGI